MNVVLASNACDKLYGNINEANHFYVDLPQEIKFPENESIGAALKEITYTSNIPTIIDEYISISKKADIVMKDWARMGLTWKAGQPLTQSGAFIYFSKKKKYEFFYATELPTNTSYDATKTYYMINEGWPFENVFPISKLKGKYDGNYLLFHVVSKKTAPLKIKKDMKISMRFHTVMEYEKFDNIPITPGYYNSFELLCEEINKKLIPYNCEFALDDTKKFVLKRLPMNYKITLENGLEYTLGFRKKELDKKGKVADYAPSLDRGIFAFFIYMNILSETLCGDKMVPLLRTVHLPKSAYGSVVNQVIEQPIYVSINRNSIKSIEVLIMDEVGKPIPFRSSKVLMTLEFKRL